MVDYQRLKNEVVVDPIIRGYGSMTDQQIFDSMVNTIDRLIIKSTVVGALGIMREVGPTMGAAILDKLEAAATADSRLKWFMKELTTNGIDLGHPVTRATIDELVTGGVLLASEGAALKQVAESIVSRAEELLLTKFYVRDITFVRNL